MKECEQKRKLAFYKRSGKPWTQDEYRAICEYVGDGVGRLFSSVVNNKYAFDDGADKDFFSMWSAQQDHNNFKNCKQVAYEDIFNEDGTVKGEHRHEDDGSVFGHGTPTGVGNIKVGDIITMPEGEQMEEVVTVGSKKELAELLMREPGVKWTGDGFDDNEYCYYDEYASDSPFIFVDTNGVEADMRGAWFFKTWRKVKPQFKKYDVVEWHRNGSGYSVIDIWNETGVFTGIPNKNFKMDNVEPYTGPVPKHIQDFIDEMKAKEK